MAYWYALPPPVRQRNSQGEPVQAAPAPYRKVQALNDSPSQLELYQRGIRQLNDIDVPKYADDKTETLYARRKVSYIDASIGRLDTEVTTVRTGLRTPTIVLDSGAESGAIQSAARSGSDDLSDSNTDTKPTNGRDPSTPAGQAGTPVQQQSSVPVFDDDVAAPSSYTAAQLLADFKEKNGITDQANTPTITPTAWSNLPTTTYTPPPQPTYTPPTTTYTPPPQPTYTPPPQPTYTPPANDDYILYLVMGGT